MLTPDHSISLSGGSEYRYNGRVTSYAQYNAKLMQFNILVKAKNFLVFQGDVEAVASQSAKDLSKLVDQISGSLDLREEYEEAKVAMDKATENSTFAFNKRRGINSEIKQFREQKSEAERYEKLLDDKDELVRQHLLWKLFHIDQDVSRQSETIQDLSTQLAELQDRAGDEEQSVTAARAGAGRVQRDILAQETVVKQAQAELSEVQPRLETAETRIAYFRRAIENAEHVRERVQADLIKHNEKVTKLRADRETAQAAAEAAEARRQAAAEAAGLALNEQDHDEYLELKAIAEGRAMPERQQFATMERSLRAATEAIRSLEDKASQLLSQRERLQEEQNRLRPLRSDAEARISQLDVDLARTRAEAEQLRTAREEIRSRERLLQQSLQETLNRLLQAQRDQRESDRAVRMRETISTLTRLFPGVRGRIIDLCEPTQAKYGTAISTVLGRNADAIVVDHEKTAIDCIEYLRNQRVGQATFIPLDTIQVKPLNDRLRSLVKGARLAIDVMRFPGNVLRAVQHACGNALVCDTLAIARQVAYEHRQEGKAVTLDGTIIHKSGLITGGQDRQAPTRRWDEKELMALQRQKDTVHAELKELQKRKVAVGDDGAITGQISTIEADLAGVRDELRALESKLSDLAQEDAVALAQVEQVNPQLDAARATVAAEEARTSGLRATIAAAEDEVFADFCERIGVPHIRAYEERQVHLLEAQAAARLQSETHVKRITHQLNFELQTISGVEERLSTLARSINRERSKMQTTEAQRDDTRAEVESLQGQIEAASARRGELQDEHDEAKQALAVAKRSASQAIKALDAAHRQIAACNDTIERLGSERSEIYRRCRLEVVDLPLTLGDLASVPLMNAADENAAMDVDQDSTEPVHVRDYGIQVDFSDLTAEERRDGSDQMEQSFAERIDEVRSEIDRMVPNMKANERLGDTETKLAQTEQEFERSRREAKRARDEFARIKRRRCELFNRAYNHISERIDPIYKELTKGRAAPMGGIAYLSLEDTEEPYLSGIKYHAMPPMKRFRDMDQLSGGEKTMAALALLFAIHSYQPAPFFVLDEVDAALDSQNVAKVSDYIRQHANDAFQFIVISLKASLYERSQALVGIYRDQEVNSSATLTLNLESYA